MLLPVCSAAVAAQKPALHHRAMSRVTCCCIRSGGPNDWPDWFAGAGVDDPPLDKSMAFENSTLTYQGAVDGLGVAIAQVAFVIDEIERGRLVAPLDFRLRGDSRYFLVFPRDKRRLNKVRLFETWSSQEASMTRMQLG